MSFEILPAKPTDVSLILDFIKQLAEYEKHADDVTATENDLTKTLFGEKPSAEVVIAYVDKTPIGFALYFENYSTFLGQPGIYLEDLFVKPEYRGHGYGKALLAYLAKTTKNRGYQRLQWWVLNWNKPAIDFYEGLGAKPMDEWTVYRVSGNELEALAEEKTEENVTPLHIE